MTKNWIALNIVLLLIAGSLAWQLHLAIDRFNAQNNTAKIVPARDLKQSSALEGGLAPMPQVRPNNAADFSIIPEKNVFSALRAREEKTEVAAVPEIPPLTQKPILIGVTIVGNQRMASILDPARQSSGGRKSQIKRPGDIYQGYTITDITEEQMVLEAGTRKEIIPLHLGAKRPAQGGKTPIIPTRVIAIGPGGSSGGAVAQPASASAGGAASRAPVPPPSPAPAASAQPAQTGTRSVQSQTQPAVAAPQTQPSRGGGSGSTQGKRIIRTPFGDVVAPDSP
jgi:hypothetical protein